MRHCFATEVQKGDIIYLPGEPQAVLKVIESGNRFKRYRFLLQNGATTREFQAFDRMVVFSRYVH